MRSARNSSTGKNATIAAIRPTKASTPNRNDQAGEAEKRDADM